MDDAVPIPSLLKVRPDSNAGPPDGAGDRTPSSRIAHFDPDSPSVLDSSAELRGIRIFPDFVSPAEAEDLLREIKTSEFVQAQSGKLKQHYGPKINFNKKKMGTDNFKGLPTYTARIEDRLRRLVLDDSVTSPVEHREFSTALRAFETTDVFVLRYLESEASNLDFHLDDTFAYGELILDLSLESDSVLTFLRNHDHSDASAIECVRVPLPARSLAAVYGPARFEWEHAILSYDIDGQRTSITFRTLHEDLRRTEAGQRVLEIARRSRSPHG